MGTRISPRHQQHLTNLTHELFGGSREKIADANFARKKWSSSAPTTLALTPMRSALYRSYCLVIITILASLLAGSALAQSKTTRAVELTFLKSNPGERERLKAFLKANWFAMDEVAVEQGLMSSYRLLDSGSDEGEWNLIVAVSYPDQGGYESIAERFEAIRKAHKMVLIDGKNLSQLGRIVESKKLYEDVAELP
jgi:hypothetical protein